MYAELSVDFSTHPKRHITWFRDHEMGYIIFRVENTYRIMFMAHYNTKDRATDS